MIGLGIEGRYIYGLSDLRLDAITTTGSCKTRSSLLLAGLGL